MDVGLVESIAGMVNSDLLAVNEDGYLLSRVPLKGQRLGGLSGRRRA
jgi:hypothetical protein